MTPANSRPVPKPPQTPPGVVQLQTRIRTAQGKDEYLNPEEQLVRLRTRHQLDPERWADPDPRGKIEERLEYGWVSKDTKEPLSYQGLRQEVNVRVKFFKESLADHGWTVEGRYASHRIRVEGKHPSGAVAMLTIKIGDTSFQVSRYALGTAEGEPWRSVGAEVMREFVGAPKKRVKGVPAPSRCTCPKSSHATEREARRAVLKLKMKKALTGGTGIAGHVYRCDDEDRAWHYSRQPDGRRYKPKGLWKEQNNAGNEAPVSSTEAAKDREPAGPGSPASGEETGGQLAEDRRTSPPE